jgi:DNA-binding HxlR family transcriptional regulator
MIPGEQPCSAHRAIAVLQEKWVMYIIDTLLDGTCGFNELSRRIGGCNSATLTQRLEQLERLGIISKDIDPDANGKLARSIYQLTDAGRALQVVMEAIDAWGRKYLPAESEPSAPAEKPSLLSAEKFT